MESNCSLPTESGFLSEFWREVAGHLQCHPLSPLRRCAGFIDCLPMKLEFDLPQCQTLSFTVGFYSLASAALLLNLQQNDLPYLLQINLLPAPGLDRSLGFAWTMAGAGHSPVALGTRGAPGGAVGGGMGKKGECSDAFEKNSAVHRIVPL